MREKSMRFLFFTDTHIRGTTPANRKDNFFETLKNKFNEISKLSHDLNVDFILHGGDWFDRPDISPAVVREFAEIVQGFNKKVYTIAGNHDIYGHNPETIGRTMLGLIDGLGVLQLLKASDEIILEKDGIKVQLTGKPYKYDIDSSNFKEYYEVKKGPDVKYAINLVHGMLLNKPFFEGINYTLIDDILGTEADVTLAGHFHSGFGIKFINSKYFINPGSLVRINNYITEITRRPMVVIIDLNDNIQVQEIELQSALPGDEVLDRTYLETSQDKNYKLLQFYQGIEQSLKFERVDLNKLIEEIASNIDLSKEVKDESIRRIAIAMESLSKGEDD
jgi:DNA repair protein SbcD/Mre11